MVIAGHPLRRPRRAELPHRVLASRQTAMRCVLRPHPRTHQSAPTPSRGPVSATSDSVFGASCRVARSAWPAAFPPVPPRLVSKPCSRPSSVLRSCTTSQLRSSAACGLGLPAALQRLASLAFWRNLGSPELRARWFRTCTWSSTPGSPCPSRDTDEQDVTFRVRGQRRHSRHGYFRGSLHGLHVPLLTLRSPPHGWPRIARGRHGSLLLCRATLAFAPSRRLISALPPTPRLTVACLSAPRRSAPSAPSCDRYVSARATYTN